VDAEQPVETLPHFAAPSPFERACERCGNYAPLSAKYGPELCAECIERTAHPIVRSGTSVGDLLSGVFQLLRAVGLPAAILVTLAGLPIALLEYAVPELPFFVSSLWGFFVTTSFDMVVLHLAWQAIVRREQRVAIGEAFSAVGRSLGTLLGVRFVANLVTLLFTLLLIVPGVMKAMSLLLVMPIALHENNGDAMSSSTQRMQGHRMNAFIACCVAAAPLLLAVSSLVCVSVVLAVAQNVDGTAPAAPSGFESVLGLALGIVIPVTSLPLTLVPAVLYAKLQETDWSLRN